MKPLLIEPTDVLFFRDAIPMSAGQGKGTGARIPFPSTLHEALRASLLLATGEKTASKKVFGRPSGAPRKGYWHKDGKSTDRFIATRAFQSLQCVGPLPWHEKLGLLLPVPLDVAFERDLQRLNTHFSPRLRRKELWRDNSLAAGTDDNRDAIRPACLPLSIVPPDKHGQVQGWWTLDQFRAYLDGQEDNSSGFFVPILATQLWETEHRIGLEINPSTFAAAHGQIYAGSYLRLQSSTRFAAQVHLARPQNGETAVFDQLDWLLLGGEHRLARLWHRGFDNPFARIPPVPIPLADGPCILKWVLLTPAIFAWGGLPGWCVDSTPSRPLEQPHVPCVHLQLPGRARLISWCLAKPLTVSGWDVVDQCAKHTRLAVSASSVYYFLCENQAAGRRLAELLHWRPRSDFYGEKGCGYGLCSFRVNTHRTSADVASLAEEFFGR